MKYIKAGVPTTKGQQPTSSNKKHSGKYPQGKEKKHFSVNSSEFKSSNLSPSLFYLFMNSNFQLQNSSTVPPFMIHVLKTHTTVTLQHSTFPNFFSMMEKYRTHFIICHNWHPAILHLGFQHVSVPFLLTGCNTEELMYESGTSTSWAVSKAYHLILKVCVLKKI